MLCRQSRPPQVLPYAGYPAGNLESVPGHDFCPFPVAETCQHKDSDSLTPARLLAPSKPSCLSPARCCISSVRSHSRELEQLVTACGKETMPGRKGPRLLAAASSPLRNTARPWRAAPFGQESYGQRVPGSLLSPDQTHCTVHPVLPPGCLSPSQVVMDGKWLWSQAPIAQRGARIHMHVTPGERQPRRMPCCTAGF